MQTLEEIRFSLESKRHHDYSNDDDHTRLDYWMVSDIKKIFEHQNISDFSNIPELSKKIEILKHEVYRAVPSFNNTHPQHLICISYKKDNNIVYDYKISPVLCEYIFQSQRFPEARYAQAYFLNPTKYGEELQNATNNIILENARAKFTQTSLKLASVVNNAYNVNPTSHSEVWGSFWCTLYNTDSFDSLRFRHNIKVSVADYLKPNTLLYLSDLLKQFIDTFYAYKARSYSVQTIKAHMTKLAITARKTFASFNNAKPENHLLPESTAKLVNSVKNKRINFWKQNFPLSLTR